jgi:hypothetical protein
VINSLTFLGVKDEREAVQFLQSLSL